MNPKNTWLLAGLAAGLFAFIFFVERHWRPAAPVVAKVLPDFNAEEVTSIQIQPRGEALIRVERTNGGWKLTEPVVYPVQDKAIESLLQALVDLPTRTHISPQQMKDPRHAGEEYGFDTPLSVIVLQQAGRERQLKLGSPTASGDQIYAQEVGAVGIEVIDGDFYKFVPRKAADWRDTTFVTLQGVAFDGLVVASGTKPALEFQRDATSKLWRMIGPDRARADSTKINRLLANLQLLRASSFVTDKPGADLEGFGLQPPESELTFKQGTNRLFSLQFGKRPDTNSENIYARSNGQSTIVLVPRELVAGWRDESEAFRERHLVNFNDSTQPDTIEVSGPENREIFTLLWASNGIWHVTDAQKQSFAPDRQAFLSLIRNLADLEVAAAPGGPVAFKGVVPESDWGPKYGLSPPARRYLIKRTNAPLAQLDFGSTNENGRIFARRSEDAFESSVYEVRLEDFLKLPAEALQLRNRQIWNFDATNVTRLTIRMNGKTWVYEHMGLNRWAIPTTGVDILTEDRRFAMEQAAGLLGTLEAERWVERGDQNRAGYGLTNNPMQLSLEVKEGDQSRALSVEIGALSPRGQRYAAVQQDGQNWIFEFPRADWGQLELWLRLNDKRE